MKRCQILHRLNRYPMRLLPNAHWHTLTDLQKALFLALCPFLRRLVCELMTVFQTSDEPWNLVDRSETVLLLPLSVPHLAVLVGVSEIDILHAFTGHAQPNVKDYQLYQSEVRETAKKAGILDDAIAIAQVDGRTEDAARHETDLEIFLAEKENDGMHLCGAAERFNSISLV